MALLLEEFLHAKPNDVAQRDHHNAANDQRQGNGAGAIALTLIIGGIVVVSLGYIVWLRVKKFLKK